MRTKSFLASLVVVGLLTVPPLAAAPAASSAPLDLAAPVIERGIDIFTTTANGKTFYDFAENPIPAGFFCPESPAFTASVAFRGLPLETAVPGQLRGSDTVIERLDDAAFNADGVATTRIRFRALSLVSIDPIRTPCGAFHVYVSLAGKQPVTKMHIFRSHENGGSFVAPLEFRVRMTFVPVEGPATRKLELVESLSFGASAIPWTLGTPETKQVGLSVVDTNGDLTPDTRLSGTSNFAPGWSPSQLSGLAPRYCSMCEPESCHMYQGKEHCTGPVYACYPTHCP